MASNLTLRDIVFKYAVLNDNAAITKNGWLVLQKQSAPAACSVQS
ncbi:MAG: hypothetical protein P4L87_18210 [Formivibrio sp.]|nr:hypothetical protein [Formivibrio sp.]